MTLLDLDTGIEELVKTIDSIKPPCEHADHTRRGWQHRHSDEGCRFVVLVFCKCDQNGLQVIFCEKWVTIALEKNLTLHCPTCDNKGPADEVYKVMERID